MKRIALVSCFLVSLISVVLAGNDNKPEVYCSEREICIMECNYLLVGNGDIGPFQMCLAECLRKSVRDDCND